MKRLEDVCGGGDFSAQLRILEDELCSTLSSVQFLSSFDEQRQNGFVSIPKHVVFFV